MWNKKKGTRRPTAQDSGAALATQPGQPLLDDLQTSPGQGSGTQARRPPDNRKKKRASVVSRTALSAKRGRKESSDEQSEDEQDHEDKETWQEHLQRLLKHVPNGAREYDNLRMKMNKAVERLLQDKMERKMMEAVKRDKEYDNCARSLMAFNVDKWRSNYEDDPLDERITEDIHRMCKYSVTVLEVVPLTQQDGRPMAAKITLGSPRQKMTLFRAVAEHIKSKTKYGDRVQTVSFRDCFPHEKTLEAKKLADKGMDLKRRG